MLAWPVACRTLKSGLSGYHPFSTIRSFNKCGLLLLLASRAAIPKAVTDREAEKQQGGLSLRLTHAARYLVEMRRPSSAAAAKNIDMWIAFCQGPDAIAQVDGISFLQMPD